mgnify:CR=1 FL=1
MKQQPTFSQPQSARVGYWLSALLTGLTAAGMLFSAAAVAAPADSDDSITIYSRLQPGAVRPELYRPVAGRHSGGQVPGYAIVRHDRAYDIEKGLHTLRVTDIAALIDPTTVTFSSLDDPGTRVLEQSFQFDLVSQARLIERYLGENAEGEPLWKTQHLWWGWNLSLDLQDIQAAMTWELDLDTESIVASNLDRFPVEELVRLRARHLTEPGLAPQAADHLRERYQPDLIHAHFGWSGIRMLLLKQLKRLTSL